MSNIQRTQLPQNVLLRRSRLAKAQQPRNGVWQDNPAPPRARIATPQPASNKIDLRAKGLNTTHTRSQHLPNTHWKTVKVTVWVKPVVKAELESIAHERGLSVSKVGAAFLENALQQNLSTQHAALLDPIINKAIAKQMRSYSTRIALLLVRVAFDAGQTRSLVTNILSRHPGVTQAVLTQILNGSSNAAKRNITRVTPQLTELIEEVGKWMGEGENTHA